MNSLISKTLLILCLLSLIATKKNSYAQTQKSNTYIYFASSENSRGRDIVRMHADGSSRVTLTTNNGNSHYPHHNGPVLSPDGLKIAYHSDTDSHDRYAIWTMHIDGSNKTRITQKEGLYANWSPDGQYIIFSGRRNGVWEILRVPSKGGKEQNLSKNFKKKNQPSWGAHCSYHPSGESIIFTYVREKILYAMNLKTEAVTQIAPSTALYSQPAFSKDGTQIAVNRRLSESKGYDLILISTSDNTSQTIVKNVLSYATPSWSQSGKELLFCGMVKGNQQVFKVHIETKEELQLTKSANFNAFPTW